MWSGMHQCCPAALLGESRATESREQKQRGWCGAITGSSVESDTPLRETVKPPIVSGFLFLSQNLLLSRMAFSLSLGT